MTSSSRATTLFRFAKPVDEQGIERIINALNSPDSQDATAAGVGFGDDGELAPMLRVARIAEYVTPASLERRVDDEARPAIHDETAVRPAPTPEPSIGASSTIIVATEGGTGVRLGLPPPVGVGSFATIVVNQVPMIGLIAKADGTVVNPGSMLTLPELAGLQYLPPADYNESDPIGKFAYTISDGGLSATGTVAVNLLLANDPPLAVADVASTNEDTPLAGNVLINDSDPNHDALTVTQFSVGGVSYAAGTSATISGVGTLVMQSDGAYTFTPTVNYHGPVPTVSYTIGDGDQSATSTLTIAVDSVNDVPKGQNDTASTSMETPSASPAPRWRTRLWVRSRSIPMAR